MNPRLYIDVHILQTVPPANLNRDDQGNPKEAYFGGVRRSRVSSQAWKRATRMAFAGRLPEEKLATRTKKIASQLTERLEARTDLDPAAAARIAGALLLATLDIRAGKKAGDTAYLLFYGRQQLEEIVNLVVDQLDELAVLDDVDLAAAVKEFPVREKLGAGHPMDVALFGRMVAEIPSLNVDAATQVAHALSTHATELEFDYYTAVDDENAKEETGAGMIGTIGFNSATLYRYATVSLHQLTANLGEDTAAAFDAVELFLHSFARSAPSGYGNSFAHRTLPSLVAVVVRRDQPVNLVSAFENPVRARNGIVAVSARRLAREHILATSQWGDTPLHTGLCHTFDPDDEETSATAAALSTAFCPAQPFPTLLAKLRASLIETVKQG
ncbi:type I-E CRISPR-associated protein Cas7/Cse4/CasC [Frankia sp. Cr2]|uniref:type I-E CRISPR-associated protein Cas7/Cse4/CasC n=1 Tax=Frankia sp. Cr2 TaxID=3073932 RepID=UPI002AD288BE|nr:type I-E CRISPR-associated protein Cas7/Cse4/CasC [Frankia sp. Cr2]